MVGFSPIDVGVDAIIFVAGKDIVTGEECNRAVLAACIIPPGVLDTGLKQAAKHSDDVGEFIVKNSDDIIDASKNGTKGVSKPKLIKNKFPDEALPNNGEIINYTVQDGKIQGLNGLREVDFVVDSNGKLIIGNKHHYLGNSKDVQAAGQLKLDGEGRIRRIDNKSGHYRPTPNEALNYPELFKQNGLNVKNSWFELYDIKVDGDGFIEDIIRVSSQKLK